MNTNDPKKHKGRRTQFLAGLFVLVWTVIPAGVGARSTSLPTTGAATLQETVTQADFNSDGIADNVRLVDEDFNRAQIQIFVSGLSRSNRIVLDEKIVRVVAIDVDRDGDSDLVALTRAPCLLVWLNDGRGHFFPRVPCPSPQPPAKRFLDPDSDSELVPSVSLATASFTTLAEVWSFLIVSCKRPPLACGLRLRTSPRAPPFPSLLHFT
ncbi:MAG: hypothetical protein ACRD2L_24550 [Terriglobia bacterium]